MNRLMARLNAAHGCDSRQSRTDTSVQPCLERGLAECDRSIGRRQRSCPLSGRRRPAQDSAATTLTLTVASTPGMMRTSMR